MATYKKSVSLDISNYLKTNIFVSVVVTFEDENYRITGSTTIGTPFGNMQQNYGDLEFEDLEIARDKDLKGKTITVYCDISKFKTGNTSNKSPVAKITVEVEAGDDLIGEVLELSDKKGDSTPEFEFEIKF